MRAGQGSQTFLLLTALVGCWQWLTQSSELGILKKSGHRHMYTLSWKPLIFWDCLWFRLLCLIFHLFLFLLLSNPPTPLFSNYLDFCVSFCFLLSDLFSVFPQLVQRSFLSFYFGLASLGWIFICLFFSSSRQAFLTPSLSDIRGFALLSKTSPPSLCLSFFLSLC